LAFFYISTAKRNIYYAPLAILWLGLKANLESVEIQPLCFAQFAIFGLPANGGRQRWARYANSLRARRTYTRAIFFR
jgi:hypothetical protein